MRSGPVTKLHKRNQIPLKNFDADFMSENYDFIVIFQIYV